jgi:hypothetical protein
MTIPISEKVVIWKFGGKPGTVKAQNQYSTAHSGNGYNMFCKVNNQFLTYKETNVGISIGYTTSPAEHKIHFKLPDDKERDILTGEPVAFGIGGGNAFLKYAHRTFGINLEWVSAPQFQWRIYGATSEKGKPIPTDSWVALVNEKVEPEADFLVYLDRPTGADVGWTTSPDWKGKAKDWLTKEAFHALIAVLLA